MRDAELSVTEAPRWWVEGLRAALDEAGRAEDSSALAEAFAARVPSGYLERTEAAVAAADLLALASLGSAGLRGGRGGGLRMAAQPDPDPGAGMFRLRLYGRRAMELSSFIPILESFGLTVVEAVPHQIPDPEGGKPLHLDDFGLRSRFRCVFEPAADGVRLVAAVQAAWRGSAEVDSLNRLVVCAALDWHDVVVLRAYRRYRRQVGTSWSDRQLDDPLIEFPAVALALLRYFAARFDPLSSPPEASTESARQAVVDALASVERLEHDQVLRGYLGLVDATLRTSHYARSPGGEGLATLALKLDGRRVPDLPPPRPHVETFVYSPRVEGLHLRGGPIARGGIRWSDRQDDLHTEVLRLVRAQVLKNAGIVPTGAKGVFVCKRLGGDRGLDGGRDDGAAAPGPAGVGPAGVGPADVGSADVDPATEVRECYRRFVSGLLDLTDNVVGGRVVRPPGVRAVDGDDTYLVVAADRGTAAVSDLANEISADHAFWLGDAFASGGHHGYDHKAMGITARGAWVAARQHFRQLGIDPEGEEIRVLGVGDMSGDVFGNGMLQSRTIKLIAAFDHRHIFVDPDPDPARAYAARTRLFELPRSSWWDYERSALSRGGGVWARSIKEISLSPEAQGALGLSAGVISPPELVSAILTAPADLLWLGGIGTFVKAPGESNADVGDRANDAVRVTADQVRARVVAEAGNLGFTQRARIVYSRRGGKINADFIDNAAGVATSDYEVNVKILLALASEQGRISADERDRLLASVQDEVAHAVLQDVGLTALAVTRAVPASAVDLDAYEALIIDLEAAGRLDREVDALPVDEDMARRRAAGAGLTRPEAAVVLALAKSDLADAVEASAFADDPVVHDAVTAYFPATVAIQFHDLMGRHRLYRQLAATRVAHEIIDRMGVTWAHETADEFGVGLADAGRAYWAARRVLGADQRWRHVEDLASFLSSDVQEVLDFSVAEGVHRLARRYLLDGRGDRAGDAGRDTQAMVDADRAVAVRLEAAPLTGDGATKAKELVELGVDPSVAETFARLPAVALAADVGWVIRALGAFDAEALLVIEAFDACDSALGLAEFRHALGDLAVTSRWSRWQVRRLEDDVASLRREAVLAALATGPVIGNPTAAVAEWLAQRAAPKARFQRLAAHLHDPESDGQCVAALAIRCLSDVVRSVT
ncbi:MAG: glutamate dehydrogenase [Acidimicrobiaceae bacterium]|nr:glutamate dehydrogenase [Acidimicrobiaceae bacterium]